MRNEIRNLFCIVPPYRHRNCPPAGAAALLAHLKAANCPRFDFLDLRLMTPDVYIPTFDPVGLFGESFVIDVPDLPLVLRVLKASDEGADNIFGGKRDTIFDDYCYGRGIEPARLQSYLLGMEQFLEDAFASLDTLSFVGFSIWSSNLTTTLIAAARLKRRQRPPFVVAGGPQVTESRASALLALRAGLLDAVVLGEGEQAMVDVYRAHEEGRPIAGLPGVLTIDSQGKPVEPAPRPLLRLADLAPPDFSGMDLAAYRSHDREFRLPFQLSRGCTDKCTFCSEWVFWERYRSDTSEHAVARIKELQARYRTNRFHFTDSLINGHMKRLRSFAEDVVEDGLSLNWGGFMRADMDAQTAKLLRKSGFSYAYIGIESLSDQTLSLMNKRRDSADNIRAVRAFLDAGIPVAAGVIPGFPGDSRERFLGTLRELARIADAYPGMFTFNVEPFVVSPAQPLYRDLEKVGLVPFPWGEAVLDIAPRYRDLTELIHCHVEGANQGVERLGQLRLLNVILSGRRADPSSGVASRGEDLPPDRVRMTAIGPAHLVLAKRRGRIVAAILTRDERADCISLVERGGHDRGLFERDDFQLFWDRLQAEQCWPSRSRPWPVRSLESVYNAEAFIVPDYVAGRIVQESPGLPVLLIANAINMEFESAEIWAAPLLAWLAAEPRPRAIIDTKLAKLGVEPGEWFALLERLIERGIVAAADPPQ